MVRDDDEKRHSHDGSNSDARTKRPDDGSIYDARTELTHTLVTDQFEVSIPILSDIPRIMSLPSIAGAHTGESSLRN
jgi:hypothetical protein